MAQELGEVLEPRQKQPDLKAAWTGWLGDPANQASLMQAGLALMQPVAHGQTPTGHIANAIGQGYEAGDRSRTIDLKQEQREQEMGLAEREISAKETVAGAAATRAARSGGKSTGGLSMRDILNQKRTGAKEVDSEVQSLAKTYFEQANDPLSNADSPYKGKSQAEIALAIVNDESIMGAIRKRRQATGLEAADPAAPTAAPAPVQKPATAQLIEQYAPQWKRAREMAKSANPQERARATAVLQQLRNAVADPDVFDRVVGQ